MLQKFVKIIFVLLIFQGILHSCKKEKDETGPKITFTSPFDNQNFSVYDYIHVQAEIKDQTAITAVSVTLVDVNYAPVESSVHVSASSPSMLVDIEYPLTNIHLENGLYYVMISSTDGKNDSHEYQPVNITAVPRKLTKVFIATKPNSTQSNLFYIDSSFSAMNFFRSFTGDYLGTSVSSYDQLAFMCGNYNGSFTAISVKDNSVKYNVPAVISSAPSFTAYYGEDRNTYIGRFDETVKGYNNSGFIIYTATANTGYYVTNMSMNNGFLVAEETSKTGGPRILVSFYSTGTPEQQTIINQDVVSLIEKDDHDVFLFGNNSGQGVIQLYDRLANNIWNPYPYPLPAGSILSAVKIDADTYLIGHSNGIIYKYQYQNSSLTPYLPGYTALSIKMDGLNNNIYIAEQNRISCVNLFAGALVNSIPSVENVKDVSLLYNK